MDDSAAQHSRPAVIVPHRTVVFVAALIATFIPAVESSIVAVDDRDVVADPRQPVGNR